MLAPKRPEFRPMLSMLGKVIQGFVSIVQAIQPFVSANPYRFRFSIAPVVAHQVSSISFRMSDPCEPARIGKYFKADPALLVINISRCFHGIPPIQCCVIGCHNCRVHPSLTIVKLYLQSGSR